MTSAWTVAGLAGLAPQDYPGPSLGAFAGSMTIMNNYPACTNTGANRSIGQRVEMWLDTNLIQGWVDGTIENNGLALTASESDKWAWKRFTSSNHASGLYAPKLYLTYNGIPQVEKQYPPFGYTAPTLTPELVVLASDADQQPQPLTYRFVGGVS